MFKGNRPTTKLLPIIHCITQKSIPLRHRTATPSIFYRFQMIGIASVNPGVIEFCKFLTPLLADEKSMYARAKLIFDLLSLASRFLDIIVSIGGWQRFDNYHRNTK